jgi:cytoskeletal protein CcmA (bactofilin family)
MIGDIWHQDIKVDSGAFISGNLKPELNKSDKKPELGTSGNKPAPKPQAGNQQNQNPPIAPTSP